MPMPWPTAARSLISVTRPMPRTRSSRSLSSSHGRLVMRAWVPPPGAGCTGPATAKQADSGRRRAGQEFAHDVGQIGIGGAVEARLGQRFQPARLPAPAQQKRLGAADVACQQIHAIARPGVLSPAPVCHRRRDRRPGNEPLSRPRTRPVRSARTRPADPDGRGRLATACAYRLWMRLPTGRCRPTRSASSRTRVMSLQIMVRPSVV